MAAKGNLTRRRLGPPEDWDLFTIDIDTVTVVFVDAGQLIIDRWSATKGRRTVCRG